MNIGIVHPAPLTIEVLKRVVQAAGYRVAWDVTGGTAALQRCAREPVEVLIMSLELPDMDGVDATCRIMKTAPCSILLLSDAVDDNMSRIFEAMGCGALDAIATPRLAADGTVDGADALVRKLQTLRKLGRNGTVERPRSAGRQKLPCLVVIGSSTGGPRALADVLGGITAGVTAAFVVVQHVDAQFAAGLADWLDGQTALTVTLAHSGDSPQIGRVLLAGTNDHLLLTPSQTLQYSAQPVNCPYRPSVDIFFKSVAANWPVRSTAVLLTGMGSDGAEGLAMLREAGWHTIAQDESSSVVYGMPKAAARLNAAAEILPLDAIAASIAQRCRDSG